MDVREQIELTRRLLAMCHGVPADHRIELTAGELLPLLRALAQTAELGGAGWRMPRGSVWARVEPWLREHGSGSLTEISRALRIPKQSILNAVKSHGCEKVAGTYRWALRTREPLAVSDSAPKQGGKPC